MSASVLRPAQACVDRYVALRAERRVPFWWKPSPQRLGWWRHKSNGLAVIETVNRERDDRLWHHVSVRRACRLPTVDDLKLVRADFVGEDRECYSIFPPASRWVNTHPFALHLWAPLDFPDGVLPDMRHLGQI